MRIVFDSIVQASKLVNVGRPDSETDLDADLRLLARAYRADDPKSLVVAAFDDPRGNVTGYYDGVEDYYTGTAAQLSAVHCPEGAVHFGLDWDGVYRTEGFYAQADVVHAMIESGGCRRVLETGPGKGFNTVYLARKNPGVSFVGIDLTPLHVRLAREAGKGVANVEFIEGSFQDMPEVASGSFDLVFDVEALCHSDTPEKLDKVLSEIHRVLRPGGRLVSFDYLRSDGFDRAPDNARLAVELVERAWVVERFHVERDWDAAVTRAGFRSVESIDVRKPALPSVLRLYRQARMFYLFMNTPLRPLIAKLLRRSTHNAVSALMLPYAFGLGALEYRQMVLEKMEDGSSRLN